MLFCTNFDLTIHSNCLINFIIILRWKKTTRRRFRIRKIDLLCQFSLRSLHGMFVSIRNAFTLFIIVFVARQTHTLITKIDELLISSFVFACSHFTLNYIAFFLLFSFSVWFRCFVFTTGLPKITQSQ